MKEFIVVLNTETDEGHSPVVVGVRAKGRSAALRIAVEQAKSGELDRQLFDETEGHEIIVDVFTSFVIPKEKLIFIN